MKSLIVAATRFEIQPLLHFLGEKKKSNFRFCSFTRKITTRSALSVDILITGIGMMHTAYYMGKILSEKKYDFVINLGVAGSFDKNLALGDVINIIEDKVADLGAENGKLFLDASELKLMGRNEFTFRVGMIPFLKKIKSLHRLKKVKSITVNKVHGKAESIRQVIKKYHPQTESMEGASFFYVCKNEKIPALQIRSISNYVESRNKKNWKLELAIKNLNNAAMNIITELS